MSYKKKAPPNEAGLRKTELAGGRRHPQDSEPTHTGKIILDDKLPSEFSLLKRITPGPRLCVYSLWSSVPFIDPGAAMRRFQKGGV
jgi:hypothetical protein